MGAAQNTHLLAHKGVNRDIKHSESDIVSIDEGREHFLFKIFESEDDCVNVDLAKTEA